MIRCDSMRKWSDSAHAILTPHLLLRDNGHGGVAAPAALLMTNPHAKFLKCKSPAGHIAGSRVEPLWVRYVRLPLRVPLLSNIDHHNSFISTDNQPSNNQFALGCFRYLQ